MYRILIVDDEPLVRRGIKRSVNWNELGIEMVAEAANGVEALSQVIENVPDIILLDINMPKMDGLEFASIVRKRYPGTKIVIITGYHDFEYARSALRLGVDDYIVKPITKEDVGTIVRQQIEKLEEKTANEPPAVPDLQRQRELCNAILKKEQRAIADIPRLCEKWGWPEGRQVTFVLMRDYLSDCEIWNDGETDELAAFAILNIAGELLDMSGCGLAFETYKNEMALLLTCPEKEIGEALGEIYGSLMDFLEIPVDFAVSDRGGLKDLAELADQAREALSCSFVLYDRNIIFYRDVAQKRRDAAASRYPEQLEIQLLSRMFTGDLEHTLQLIDTFFAQLAEATLDVKRCKSYLLRLLLKISNTIESVSIRTDGSFEEESGKPGNFDPGKEVDRFATLEDAKTWLKDLYTDTYRYVTRVKSRTGQLFFKIRAYIEKHFGDSDLNLKKCSEELYLSPSYISMILKKESGKTFVDYLNEYRIKKAAEFLGRPESKIYEVSTNVGFTHPTYFSSVFKKMMGVSPKQYKESGPA